MTTERSFSVLNCLTQFAGPDSFNFWALNPRNTIQKRHFRYFVNTAALAQLGERQTEDLKVPGSIPGGGIASMAEWSKALDLSSSIQ